MVLALSTLEATLASSVGHGRRIYFDDPIRRTRGATYRGAAAASRSQWPALHVQEHTFAAMSENRCVWPCWLAERDCRVVHSARATR